MHLNESHFCELKCCFKESGPLEHMAAKSKIIIDYYVHSEMACAYSVYYKVYAAYLTI